MVLWVHWAGGHHTELRVPRPGRAGAWRPESVRAAVHTLRKVSDDEAIARTLNRAGLRTERGHTWTPRRVASFRRRHQIPAFRVEDQEREGWVHQQQAATELGISAMSVHRLVLRGILPAERHPGLPSVIKRSDLSTRSVKRAVKLIQSHGHGRLPDDPDQLDLFPTPEA